MIRTFPFLFLLLFITFSTYSQDSVCSNAEVLSKLNIADINVNKAVYIEGLKIKNDGGQGFFILVDKGNETADNGIYFSSVKKDKLWKRIIDNNLIDLNWYGVKGDGITNDFQAIQNALNYAYKNGMAVSFQSNKAMRYNEAYKLWLANEYFIGNNSLEVKYGTQLIGEGVTATKIKYTGNKSAIVLGKPMNKSQLEYGVALKNMTIYLVSPQATAIKLVGTCGAICENIYIEGFSSAPDRKTIGVHIDGGYASTFFNNFTNIICNHIQTGYKLSGTIPYQSTTSIFVNCTSLGDNIKNSIGFEFDDFCGHGTSIHGGNIEVCDIGIKIHDQGASISAYGLRFEGNQTDIQFGLYSRGSTFVGCMGINTIDNKTGEGYGANSFLGCIKEDGSPLDNKFSPTIIESRISKKVPLIVKGNANQNSVTFETQNHLSSTMFQVDQYGRISNLGGLPLLITSGFGSPENKIKAIPGSLYLQTDGGPGKTFWVKETGNDKTGWVSK